MDEQVTDSQVLTSLLAEEDLEGYTVKPWTVKQLIQVTPVLKDLAEKLGEMGITLDNWDAVASQGLQGLAGLIEMILPHLPQFLAASLRLPLTEAEELDLGLALKLAVRVLALNVDHLKNSFSLIRGQVTPLIRPEATS
ncbi:MAG: hypothetical protein FJ135_01895 [Deltaproteobacteria bacterium]|nr:hypothetical protein [Deltaproteobacteria bacterium]